MNAFRIICVSVLGAVLGMAAGCASKPVEPASRWVPAAAPRLVTMGRSTTYALVHRAGQDLLIVEDPLVKAGGKATEGRLTWIVPVPDVAAFDKPIEVGGPGTEAWLIEQIEGDQSHAAPAKGTVTIHHRNADMVSATVNLRALGPRPAAGQPQRATIDLDRRFDFARYEPVTPQYREMKSRAGSSAPKRK